MNRRIVRSLVLALLLLAFIGPWGRTQGPNGVSPMHLPEIVAHELGHKLNWVSVLVVAILAVPIACLSAILVPSSRRAVLTYRVIGAGTAVPFLAMSLRPPLADLIEEWGVTLYITALLLALAGELVPARSAPNRDYADVFR